MFRVQSYKRPIPIPFPKREQWNKTGNPTGIRNQPAGDGCLETHDIPGINTTLKTTPPIMRMERKSPEIGDEGDRSPWNIGENAEHSGLLRHGENP